MIIFYAPDIATCPELPEEESGHAVRVLRKREGEELTVVDGAGSFYQAIVTAAHPKHCAVRITGVVGETPRPYGVEIAVGPTKNTDRMEWFVEKAVEMGLDRFTPVRTAQSERKELKRERMARVAVAAMKQSLKATLPRLDEMTTLADYLAEPFDGQKFIAHCMAGEERHLLSRAVEAGRRVRVLIGPEGDFTADEVRAAIAAGYVPVSLGRERLRTETAALAAVHTVHVVNELA